MTEATLRRFPVWVFIVLVVFVAAYDYYVLLDEVTGNHRRLVVIYRVMAAALVAGGASLVLVQHRLGIWLVALGALLDGVVTVIYVLFNRYFGGILSTYDASNADEGAAVLDYVLADLMHWADLKVLVAPLALVVLAAMATTRVWDFRVKRWFLWKFDLRLVAIIMGIMMYITPYLVYRSLNEWRTQGAATFIHVGGLMGFLSYDLIDSLSRGNGEGIALNYPAIQGETYKALPFRKYSGANVIFLQVESLDSAIVARQHDGTPVAPFIQSLSQRSVNLRRHIALHTKGSVDADASVITGSFPAPYRSLYSSVDLARYPSIARDLSATGYTTAVFHSNRGSFFDRDKAVRSVGFDKWYFQPFYAEALGTGKGWGVNDEDFLRLTADEIARLPAPFFAHVITITSHAPFDFDIKGKHAPVFESIQDPLLRGYFDAIHFVDQAVEKFFGQLEEAGLLNNTVVILYGDHDAHLYYPGEEKGGMRYLSMDYLGDLSSEALSYPSHVPAMIITPDGATGVIDKPTLHVDLVPTTLNLLGLETPAETYLGNSVFSGRGTPMIIDNNKEPHLIYGGCIYRRAQSGYQLDRHTRWLDGESCPEPPKFLTTDADEVVKYSRGMWRKYRR